MENNASADDCENIDWDTEDELEISEFPSSRPTPGGGTITCNGAVMDPGDAAISCNGTGGGTITCNGAVMDPGDAAISCNGTIMNPAYGTITCNGEGSSAGPSSSKLVRHFVAMGFSQALVSKVMDENGEDCAESLIVETLLTYSALESTPEDNSRAEHLYNDSDQSSSDYDESFLHDLSDSDCWSGDELEENTDSLSEKEKKLRSLKNMGYSVEEAATAMERCGPEASILELTDFICAAQLARAEDAFLPYEVKPKVKLSCNGNGRLKKRKLYPELCGRKQQRGIVDEDGEKIRLPKPMVGFGLPPDFGFSPDSSLVTQKRHLPEQAIGPPYFYYENVALTPKGVWDTISKFLYDVEPEFVDSKYFCAAARKRGYIHNLPIHNRFPLLPIQPRTIHEAFPLTKRWWPSWDTRTKLNCLQTAIASARLQDRIRKDVEKYDGEPPPQVQKSVLDECRKWNLVWVGRNKVAPLEPDEVEVLLGFPKNHTRGGGISRTDRYKSLGNSFQVDTVAYHLSALKTLYPNGVNVLSLFSGIGGAEVALYKLGIPLKNVVSVEKSEVNRNVVHSWWEQTNQRGNLIDFDDVQALTADKLERIMDSIGGFDLVIGGSPCNNLAGSNRVSRDGLEGEQSSLFYEYFRILDAVKSIMSERL